MKFREHKGGLQESIDTEVEFETLEGLRNFLESKWELPLDSITWVHYGLDERTGWNTYMVVANFEGIMPRLPVGWSDGVLEE